jgi:hypothetical protein
MSDRLLTKKENDIIAVDMIDGQLILKRYDGSTLKYGEAVESPSTLTSITPNTFRIDEASAVVFTVIGTDFKPETKLYSGSPLNPTACGATTYVSSTELTVVGFIVNNPGSYNVWVSTSDSPTGEKSNSLSVTIPAPTIVSLNPSSGFVTGVSVDMTATGTNFVPGSVLDIYDAVQGNMPPTSTSFVSSTTVIGTFAPGAGTQTAIKVKAPSGHMSNEMVINVSPTA